MVFLSKMLLLSQIGTYIDYVAAKRSRLGVPHELCQSSCAIEVSRMYTVKRKRSTLPLLTHLIPRTSQSSSPASSVLSFDLMNLSRPLGM